MKISQWITFTVIVGALPIIVRLLVFLISNHLPGIAWINTVDIVFFGLTLNISNINEIYNLDNAKVKKGKKSPLWGYRDTFTAFSIIFILLLAVPLGALYMGEMVDSSMINQSTALKGAIALGMISLLFSGVVTYCISKIYNYGNA